MCCSVSQNFCRIGEASLNVHQFGHIRMASSPVLMEGVRGVSSVVKEALRYCVCALAVNYRRLSSSTKPAVQTSTYILLACTQINYLIVNRGS
jgi:hypothetical protein